MVFELLRACQGIEFLELMVFRASGLGLLVSGVVGVVKFHEVVGGSEELPLIGGFLEPAQQDVLALADADLAEDGFHDGFAPGIDLLASLGFQLPAHPFTQGRGGWDPAARRLRDRGCVFQPAGGNEKLGAMGGLKLLGRSQVRR